MKRRGKVSKLFGIETTIGKKRVGDFDTYSKYNFGDAFIETLLSYEETKAMLMGFINKD